MSGTGGTGAADIVLINKLQSDLTAYKLATTNTQGLAGQQGALSAEVHDLNLRMKELDRVEQTYEKEYLDNRDHPAKKSKQFGSVQDFTLAAFCFSYIFFSIVFILYAMMHSQSKFSTFVGALTMCGLVGTLIVTAIIRFG